MPVTQANDRGGEDNITALRVTLKQPENDDEAQTLNSIENIGDSESISVQIFELSGVGSGLESRLRGSLRDRRSGICGGRPGDMLYLVFTGSVDVSKNGHHLATVSAGEHFGELAFIDGEPRSAAVSAREPTTLLTINRDDFRNLTQTDPVVASKLLWCFVVHMSVRLRDLSHSYVKAWKR